MFYRFDCKFADQIIFLFFTKQNVRAQKIARVSEILRARARTIQARTELSSSWIIFF